MYWLGIFLMLLVAPFWETKAPADWEDPELATLLTDSPWAQTVGGPGQGGAVQVYLATASPIQQAEAERDIRARRKLPPLDRVAEDPLASEYRDWLKDNQATQIVLAIQISQNPAFSDEKEVRRMEEESVMRVGKKKIKMTGHFPPSATDPYLRMAFPRQVESSDKTVTFELYLPGVSMPFRGVEFKVKDMILKGKLEL